MHKFDSFSQKYIRQIIVHQPRMAFHERIRLRKQRIYIL